MRHLLTISILLLSCQTFGQVQEFVLDNGLKIIVKEDHRAPIAVSMLWYKVGSADEHGGLTGVSHAIEHMMFKGTPKYPQGEFSKIIAAGGGEQNAMTNYDYTVFYEKINASQLGKAFELEADRMNHLQFDSKEFAKEIKVIQEERRMRIDDNPQVLTMERFLATAHLSTPYNHPVIGWMSDLQQMKVDDVKQWYKTYYVPNNATLVVVGDVNPDSVHKLAELHFGSFLKKPVTPSRDQKEPPVLGQKSLTVEAPAEVPMLFMGFGAPSHTTAKPAWEPYALELIASILDEGEGSRFSKNLIRNKQIASSAGSSYDPNSKYATEFMIYGSPSQNHSIKDLKTALIQELESLKNTEVSDEELQRIKNQLIAQKTFEKDSIYSQAMEIGLLETLGLGWKRSEEFTKAIRAITPAQIQQTAQLYFQNKNMTQAFLKPSLPIRKKS